MQVIERGTSTPIDDAKISISYSGDPDSTVEEVNTDASGMSETLTLDTPPLELSMQPSEVQPYAEYTIQVTAKGYRPINISGIEVFSGQLSLQEIRMDAEKATESMTDNIVIPAHTLFAEYPPKIAEAEIKPVTETGEIVLSRVVIPEYVIVHDGAPSDPTARDYYVRYRDYTKTLPPARSIRPGRTRRPGECSCHHVVYAQSCIHGVVPPTKATALRSRPPRHTTRNSCTGATFTRASRMWWMRCSRTISPDRMSDSRS